MIRVVIADDHAVVRHGIRLLLDQEHDIDVVGEAEDGQQAVELVESLEPDVLVLDVAMPVLNGIDVVEKIRAAPCGTRIVILSMYAEKAYLAEALKHRVDSYVLKSETATTLVQVIRDTVAGRRYLSPSLLEHAINAFATGQKGEPVVPQDYSPLTPRETDVVRLVAQGLTNANIASRLGISQRTVESHRANAMRKLGLDNHAALVRYALTSGLI